MSFEMNDRNQYTNNMFHIIFQYLYIIWLDETHQNYHKKNIKECKLYIENNCVKIMCILNEVQLGSIDILKIYLKIIFHMIWILLQKM